MKYRYLLILQFFGLITTGQVTIGADFQIGSKEILQHMKVSGFNLASNEDYTIDGKKLGTTYYFKEELQLDISYNKFGNISNVCFRTQWEYNSKSLMKVLNSDKWTPVGFKQLPDGGEEDNYKLNDMRILYIYRPSEGDHLTYQICYYR